MEKLVDHEGLTARIFERFREDIKIYVSLLVIVPLAFSAKFYSGYGQSWARDSLMALWAQKRFCSKGPAKGLGMMTGDIPELVG